MWQGAADRRVRDGAEALAALVAAGDGPVMASVPPGGSERLDGVLHAEAVVAGWQAQARLIEQRRPARLLTLGGDCFVEVASVAHLSGVHGQRLFVLWVDAHADLNTPETSPSGTAHGMPLRMLLDAAAGGRLPAPGCLEAAQVALVGCRDLDRAEVKYASSRGLRTLEVAAVEAAPASLAGLPPAGAAVYVHLDLDVLNPDVMPAVAVPTPGGLSPASLVQALTAVLAVHDVVGVGITEYVPDIEHDRETVTAVLGALGLTADDASAGAPTNGTDR